MDNSPEATALIWLTVVELSLTLNDAVSMSSDALSQCLSVGLSQAH